MNLGVLEILLFSGFTLAGAIWGWRTALRQGLTDEGPGGNLVNPLVAASIARWSAGTFLFVFVVLWLANALLISGCARLDDANLLQLQECWPYLSTRFIVFAEFQNGFGALVGLLGVAWAAAYGLRRDTN